MKMVYVNELTVIGTVSGERDREREREGGDLGYILFSRYEIYRVFKLNIIEIKGKKF